MEWIGNIWCAEGGNCDMECLLGAGKWWTENIVGEIMLERNMNHESWIDDGFRVSIKRVFWKNKEKVIKLEWAKFF